MIFQMPGLPNLSNKITPDRGPMSPTLPATPRPHAPSPTRHADHHASQPGPALEVP